METNAKTSSESLVSVGVVFMVFSSIKKAMIFCLPTGPGVGFRSANGPIHILGSRSVLVLKCSCLDGRASETENEMQNQPGGQNDAHIANFG